MKNYMQLFFVATLFCVSLYAANPGPNWLLLAVQDGNVQDVEDELKQHETRLCHIVKALAELNTLNIDNATRTQFTTLLTVALEQKRQKLGLHLRCSGR